MEAAATLRSPCYSCGFPGRSSRSRVSAARIDPWSSVSGGWIKDCGVISVSKQGRRRLLPPMATRRSICNGVRASMSSSTGPSESPFSIAPLHLESPIGQFLSQILMHHPHLLPAAVDQQLEQLQNAREAEETREESTPSGTDLVLYRRIAEVKANERRRTLEEILYTLVVLKFVEADVSLVPSISQLYCCRGSRGSVNHWQSEDEKLKRLHSPEAYEMIKSHLTFILGQRLVDSSSVAPISKLQVGQVYAASAMYGYFLKRVDQRFQLEKSMKNLPWGSDDEERAFNQAIPDDSRPFAQVEYSEPELYSWPSPNSKTSSSRGTKPSRLRTYVMSFDAETLQRYATIRSKEAFSIIEKQTEALFGRPEIVITPEGTIDSSEDDFIKISFAGLRRLILEAVTFGSFLWDVESNVDSRYHFVMN